MAADPAALLLLPRYGILCTRPERVAYTDDMTVAAAVLAAAATEAAELTATDCADAADDVVMTDVGCGVDVGGGTEVPAIVVMVVELLWNVMPDVDALRLADDGHAIEVAIALASMVALVLCTGGAIPPAEALVWDDCKLDAAELLARIILPAGTVTCWNGR